MNHPPYDAADLQELAIKPLSAFVNMGRPAALMEAVKARVAEATERAVRR